MSGLLDHPPLASLELHIPLDPGRPARRFVTPRELSEAPKAVRALVMAKVMDQVLQLAQELRVEITWPDPHALNLEQARRMLRG